MSPWADAPSRSGRTKRTDRCSCVQAAHHDPGILLCLLGPFGHRGHLEFAETPSDGRVVLLSRTIRIGLGGSNHQPLDAPISLLVSATGRPTVLPFLSSNQ